MVSDLSKTLRPLLISHFPLGLAPFTVHNHQVQLRRIHSSYSLLVLVLLVILFTFVFSTEPISETYDDEVYDNTRNFINEAADNVEAYCSAIASVICVLYNLINRRKIATIINKLQWFDSSLKKQYHLYSRIQKLTKSTSKAKKLLKHIAQISAIVSTSWFCLIASGIFERLIYPEETMWQWMMYVLPTGITTQLTFQFVIVTTAVRWRFRALNKFVKQNGRPAMEYTMSAHAYLSTIVTILKDAYRNQILAVVAQSSVTIVASAFFLAYAVMHQDSDNTISLYVYTFVMWFYCNLQMASIVWICVTLTAEVKRTVTVSFSEYLDLNFDNTSRMMFAYQSMHEDTDFELCPGYPVDGSLLSNLAGTVTTYLLIVIQFEMNLMV